MFDFRRSSLNNRQPYCSTTTRSEIVDAMVKGYQQLPSGSEILVSQHQQANEDSSQDRMDQFWTQLEKEDKLQISRTPFEQRIHIIHQARVHLHLRTESVRHYIRYVEKHDRRTGTTSTTTSKTAKQMEDSIFPLIEEVEDRAGKLRVLMRELRRDFSGVRTLMWSTRIWAYLLERMATEVLEVKEMPMLECENVEKREERSRGDNFVRASRYFR